MHSKALSHTDESRLINAVEEVRDGQSKKEGIAGPQQDKARGAAVLFLLDPNSTVRQTPRQPSGSKALRRPARQRWLQYHGYQEVSLTTANSISLRLAWTCSIRDARSRTIERKMHCGRRTRPNRRHLLHSA
jgi:hypothetical protein